MRAERADDAAVSGRIRVFIATTEQIRDRLDTRVRMWPHTVFAWFHAKGPEVIEKHPRANRFTLMIGKRALHRKGSD